VAVVTTIHQAKGLEWDVVYACHVEDGSLPLLPRNVMPHSHEYVNQLEEERRLAYVCFTRARKKLVITFAEGPAEGPNRNPPTKRSRFLAGCPELFGNGPEGNAVAV